MKVCGAMFHLWWFKSLQLNVKRGKLHRFNVNILPHMPLVSLALSSHVLHYVHTKGYGL